MHQVVCSPYDYVMSPTYVASPGLRTLVQPGKFRRQINPLNLTSRDLTVDTYEQDGLHPLSCRVHMQKKLLHLYKALACHQNPADKTIVTHRGRWRPIIGRTRTEIFGGNVTNRNKTKRSVETLWLKVLLIAGDKRGIRQPAKLLFKP